MRTIVMLTMIAVAGCATTEKKDETPVAAPAEQPPAADAPAPDAPGPEAPAPEAPATP